MKLENYQDTESSIILSLSNTTVEEVMGKVEEYFNNQGYKLEKGSKEDGIYGKGNDILRLLFGVFHKRYKFNVKVNSEQSLVLLSLGKGMTGISGGPIGYKKYEDEYKKVSMEIKNMFGVQEAGEVVDGGDN